MKIGQKIFIYSFVLFLCIFNIGAVFIIENSHDLNLQREIDRGLNEHLSIYSGINVIFSVDKDNIVEKKDIKTNFLNIIITDFLAKFNDENVFIEILDKNNEKVFSSFKLAVKEDRPELINPLLNKRKYIIRDVDHKTFLFVTNLLNIDDEELKFSFIRDITYVYTDRQLQYKFFIQLEIFICIILSIGIFILTKNITTPINKLIDSTKTITSGNFSQAIKVSTKDELGVLSDNFNKMALTIDNQIKELKKKTEEKQRFIDNLTHEFKTPLTSIIGYADFLRSTNYNEKVFQMGLNHIFKEGKKLEELTWKMMDLILLNKENFEMKKEEIKNIIEDVNNSVIIKLQEKNLNLIITGENYKISVEKDLIRTLIINLIDNAVKASHPNSKIFLKTYVDHNSKKVLEIEDTGIGISQENISKVFEPFYMVDKARSRANNGAGLGLSISAEIAKIHETKLEITSNLNIGTTIKIIFK